VNFDDAIKAHAAWKIKLNSYLQHPDGSIDVAKLSLDNVCDLGHWLHGDGRTYAELPEYQELIIEHAAFHRAASDVVRRKESGQNVSADLELGASSDFSVRSTKVVKLLMILKGKIKV
jgi:Chemoreceptor zinc-binding domain